MAAARAKAWSQIVARHRGLPAVLVAGADLTRPGLGQEPARPVVVVRLDATLIEADSTKAGAAGNKGGYRFHPLTAWCTNVGDNLPVMLRPGNAGSFTASDHILVPDAFQALHAHAPIRVSQPARASRVMASTGMVRTMPVRK